MVDDERVGDVALHVEEEYQRHQQTALQHEEELETQFARCLADGCHLLVVGRAEEVLCLAQDESLGLGVGYQGEHEASEQQQRDNIVACDAVWHGVACHSESSAEQLGMEEGLAGEVRLAIVFGHVHVAPRLALAVSGQMQRVGLLAPCYLRWLDIGLDGGVLLFGRCVLWQPRQHLCGRGLKVLALLCGRYRLSVFTEHYFLNMYGVRSSVNHLIVGWLIYVCRACRMACPA